MPSQLLPSPAGRLSAAEEIVRDYYKIITASWREIERLKQRALAADAERDELRASLDKKFTEVSDEAAAALDALHARYTDALRRRAEAAEAERDAAIRQVEEMRETCAKVCEDYGAFLVAAGIRGLAEKRKP